MVDKNNNVEVLLVVNEYDVWSFGEYDELVCMVYGSLQLLRCLHIILLFVCLFVCVSVSVCVNVYVVYVCLL